MPRRLFHLAFNHLARLAPKLFILLALVAMSMWLWRDSFSSEILAWYRSPTAHSATALLISRGRLILYDDSELPRRDNRGFHFERTPCDIITVPLYRYVGPGLALMDIPVYTLSIPPAVLIPLVLFRHARRRTGRDAHLCPTCGYDLRATPDRCPECGTAGGGDALRSEAMTQQEKDASPHHSRASA